MFVVTSINLAIRYDGKDWRCVTTSIEDLRVDIGRSCNFSSNINAFTNSLIEYLAHRWSGRDQKRTIGVTGCGDAANQCLAANPSIDGIMKCQISGPCQYHD
jgi:hypothetical protein